MGQLRGGAEVADYHVLVLIEIAMVGIRYSGVISSPAPEFYVQEQSENEREVCTTLDVAPTNIVHVTCVSKACSRPYCVCLQKVACTSAVLRIVIVMSCWLWW